MKKIEVRIEQFRSLASEREEFLLCREKHLSKIVITDTYASDRPAYEQVDWIEFPINAEVIICKKYEDENRKEFSITRIQNGKEYIICERNEYTDCLTDDEYNFFFEQFDETIEELKRKKFFRIHFAESAYLVA